MRAAIAHGALSTRTTDAGAAFADVTDAGALVAVSHGACAFYERDDGGTCAIHRVLGHDALPLACRQFPRVSLRDPRGVSITLSHYCPTAASLLAAPGAIEIVADSAAFPAAGEYVGLDATSSPPPLLRPGVLMDWESWWDAERRAVALFARDDRAPGHALGRLGTAVEHARRWRPSDGTLRSHVARAFDHAAAVEPSGVLATRAWIDARRALAIDAVPSGVAGANPPPRARTDAATSPPALARFLASHAFANWTPHLGGDLRAWVRSIEVAYALATVSGVRDADLILRHLVDPREFAARCERDPAPTR